MRVPAALVTILVLAALAPTAAAQGTVVTSLSISGAGPVLDLTQSPTRDVNLQIQFRAEQGFTCTADATITVTLEVTTSGPITATLENESVTFTIPAGQSPLQPATSNANSLLSVTRVAAHEEAQATVTATYAGGTVGGCVPGTFEGSNASTIVRTTSLGGGAGPNITITSPQAGAEAAEFNMRVEVTGFELKPVPTTPGVVPGQGHIHYMVDNRSATGDYATHLTNFTFKGLSAGEHVLRAELHNNDHTPLDPPVFAEVRVNATGTGPAPTPTTSTMPSPTPTTSATPTPGTNATPTPAADDKSFLPGPGVFALAAALVVATIMLRRRA